MIPRTPCLLWSSLRPQLTYHSSLRRQPFFPVNLISSEFVNSFSRYIWYLSVRFSLPTLCLKMSTSFFDSSQWYRLSNDRTGVNRTLSLGYYPDSATPGAPDMTVAGSYSSENWQLFFQSGLYFIRNYDWGADWQLGVTANERSIPTMLQAGGLLGMQWNVTEWSDGAFKLTNMLLGSNTPLFGVGSGSTIPSMNENEQGAHWAMDINIMNDGAKISDVALLQTLSSIEVRILDYPIRHSFLLCLLRKNNAAVSNP